VSSRDARCFRALGRFSFSINLYAVGDTIGVVRSRMFLVGDRMTRKVVTAKSAETLAAAATKMKLGKFRRLPVVDSGKLVGIVSSSI
jgi:CBS domain-containing protein